VDAAAREVDGGANDAVVLHRRQRGRFTGGFADDNGRDSGLDLPLAKFRECRQIEFTLGIERRGEIRDVTRQPASRMYWICHRISRCDFHLVETLSVRRQHKALLTPDARLDPKTHLFQFTADFQAEPAFAGPDQDGNGRTRGEEWRNLRKGGVDSRKRGLPRDQADCVLPPWDATGRDGGDANEAAPLQRQIEFQAIAAGDDGAMQIG
jgi:hypothetical protein